MHKVLNNAIQSPKNPPHFTFISMRKLVLNYARSSGVHMCVKYDRALFERQNELETESKNKNIRDLYRGRNEFKKDYRPRINLVKVDHGDMLA
jgi:hypothetical protein